MNVSRRWFIGGAASFGAFQGCRFVESPFGRDGVARLKFGVISDIHIIAANVDFGHQGNTRVLKHAFRWFDAQGADGVVIAGDMADAGLISQLKCVADAWNEVFPDGKSRLDGRPVEKLFVYGNHDWDGYNYGYNIFGKPSRDLLEDQITKIGMKKSWESVFEEEYSPIYKKVIKGYSFVGGHWDSDNGSGWGTGPNLTDFFARHGKEIDPSLPFFYYQHPHPKDTCYGSWAWGHDNGSSTKALSQYSNAIAFSGHSHYSLLDERTVWQGAFTSIGTGSLRYAGGPYDEFAADGGYENAGGGKAKDGRLPADKLMEPIYTPSERNGMLLSVYDDHITIVRRDFGNDVDLGPDWVMPLPVAEPRPFAFAERAKKSVAPTFAADAKLAFESREVLPRGKQKKDFKNEDERKAYLQKNAVKTVVVKVPAAMQTFENRTYRYDVAVLDKDGKQVLLRRVLSPDYHLPIGKAVKSFELPLEVAKLPKVGPVNVRVTPYNSLGKAGQPLVACFSGADSV